MILAQNIKGRLQQERKNLAREHENVEQSTENLASRFGGNKVVRVLALIETNANLFEYVRLCYGLASRMGQKGGGGACLCQCWLARRMHSHAPLVDIMIISHHSRITLVSLISHHITSHHL